MNTNSKYAIIGALGVGAIVLGSLMFALATGGNSDDSELRVFAEATGGGLLISGIGLVIAAAATYLKKSD
ncbi:MAG TPA: hypothetical protein VIT93_07340 [Dehalococcoidia bacterium]